MSNNLFITALTSVALHNASETLIDFAEKHNMQSDRDYINNMLLINVIGYTIATGKYKEEITELFVNIVNKKDEDEYQEVINEIKDLL